MRQILALALCLALAIYTGATAFAEYDPADQNIPAEAEAAGTGEPEEALTENEPELEEPADLSGEQRETPPETLPALAPAAPRGTNPDTGDHGLFAGAIAAAVAAVAALALAIRRPRKH